eukprot:3276560-Rhodomonas_salina.1
MEGETGAHHDSACKLHVASRNSSHAARVVPRMEVTRGDAVCSSGCERGRKLARQLDVGWRAWHGIHAGERERSGAR